MLPNQVHLAVCLQAPGRLKREYEVTTDRECLASRPETSGSNGNVSVRNKFSFRPQSRAGQMAQRLNINLIHMNRLFLQLKNDSCSHLPDSCVEKHASEARKMRSCCILDNKRQFSAFWKAPQRCSERPRAEPGSARTSPPSSERVASVGGQTANPLCFEAKVQVSKTRDMPRSRCIKITLSHTEQLHRICRGIPGLPSPPATFASGTLRRATRGTADTGGAHGEAGLGDAPSL